MDWCSVIHEWRVRPPEEGKPRWVLSDGPWPDGEIRVNVWMLMCFETETVARYWCAKLNTAEQIPDQRERIKMLKKLIKQAEADL